MGYIIESPDICAFYNDGNLHREDGPAWIHADGTERWFIEGEEITDRLTNTDWSNWSEKDWTRFKITFC